MHPCQQNHTIQTKENSGSAGLSMLVQHQHQHQHQQQQTFSSLWLLLHPFRYSSSWHPSCWASWNTWGIQTSAQSVPRCSTQVNKGINSNAANVSSSSVTLDWTVLCWGQLDIDNVSKCICTLCYCTLYDTLSISVTSFSSFGWWGGWLWCHLIVIIILGI